MEERGEKGALVVDWDCADSGEQATDEREPILSTGQSCLGSL